MRLVLDTNVLIAAFLTRGVCHELVEHGERAHTLVSSTFILDEFESKLLDKFDIPPDSARAAAGSSNPGSSASSPWSWTPP